MNEYSALHIIHVFSIIVMVATALYAVAAKPETKKSVMIWSGVAALLALLSGIRMWQSLYQFNGAWPVVKIICWLALGSLPGIAYRRRAKAKLWIILSLLFTLIALVMVYAQPF